MVGMQMPPGMEELGTQMMRQQAYGKGDNMYFFKIAPCCRSMSWTT